MCIRDRSNVVFVDIITGIKDVLDEQGYHLLIGVTGYSPDAEEALLDVYKRQMRGCCRAKGWR